MSRVPLRAVAVLGWTAVVAPMLVGVPLAQAAGVDVTVDGGQTFQTIEALGADINPRSWDDGNLKPALDLLIDDEGMKTFRVGMDMMDWESRNDDSDPRTFDWGYYDPIYSGRVGFDTDQAGSSFADTWDVIDYLHQKGVPDSGIVLSFMGPGPSWMGGSHLSSGMEDEFVEGVLSAAYYGYSHGHTFGLFSPNNEMDISFNEGVTMSADRYADVLDRLAGRMDELGMDGVKLLGPETCCHVEYADPMKDRPRLMSQLGAFDFHNYGGGDNGAAEAVAGTGKSFWISEYGQWDQTFSYLDQGAAGLMMWEAYDSVYNHAVLNDLGTAPGNDSLTFGITPLLAYDEDTRTYSPRDEFYYFGQLMKWVSVGAERIGAESADSDVQVEAFHDPATHRLTLVGQNTSESTQTLSIALKNLDAPPSLDYYQTNPESHMERGPAVVVRADTATVAVPAGTTFTLTGTSLGTDTPDPTTPDPTTPDPTTPDPTTPDPTTPDPTTPAPTTPDPTTPTPTTPDPTTPAAVTAPTDLSASYDADAGGVDLRWSAPVGDDGSLHYVVHRSTVSGFTPDDGTEVGRGSATSFREVDLPAGTYYYVVTAVDAAGTTSPPSAETSATVPVPPDRGVEQLLGLDEVQDYADNDAAGEAEAFLFDATATGRAGSVALYVDSGSLATTVHVGLYSDDDGEPGTLLASGSLGVPRPDAWNTVPLDSSPVVTAGTPYWIAVLGTGGRIDYRDRASGRCSQSHIDTDLTDLPLRWTPGRSWPTCGLSARLLAAGSGVGASGE